MSRDDDYEVGYKKPPVGTRFQRGQSGNPKGRPKGSLNLATALAAALAERVTIRENGEVRRITKLDAMVKQVVNKAAGGDLRAVKDVVYLIASQLKPEAAPGEAEVLSEEEATVSQNLLKRLRRLVEAGNQNRKDSKEQVDAAF